MVSFVKVQYDDDSLYVYQLSFPAGSLSISGSVITKVLVADYIQFISFLVVVTPSQHL